jgi:hypothetical protein
MNETLIASLISAGCYAVLIIWDVVTASGGDELPF